MASVDTTQFIKKDGSVPMAADLDMGTHKIINVGQPTTDTDAASKGYIDNTLAESHLTSSHKSNEFKYLNDPNETSSEYNITVDAFTDFNESPHKNKKAFEITLQKDAGTNNYRSRMGFNLYPSPLGTYTIIFEYYFPENTNIQLSCQSTTAYVHKQVQKDFTNYSKLLVQINNNSKTTPDYLFFTIHGTAVVSNPGGYIIVYGVKDWSDSVDSSVYDDEFYVQMFKYENGDMQMQTDIDMNNLRIKNIAPPINPTDLLMKQSLEIHNIYIFGMVNNRGFLTSNNTNLKIANMHIEKFIFYGGSTYANTQDDLFVNFGVGGPLWRFPFRFGPINQATELNVNRYFNSILNNFRLRLAKQIEYELLYSPLSIKTTKI